MDRTGSFRHSDSGEGDARYLQDDDDQTQQGHEPRDSPPEQNHFVLKSNCVQFQDVQRHHLGAIVSLMFSILWGILVATALAIVVS